MQIKDGVHLSVQIAPVIKRLFFLCTANVFPSVIIGIHGMKSLEVNINLGLSSVMIKNVQIPFITGIQSESQMNTKNGQGLSMRTGVQDSKRI